jgi:hypothetical protein
VESYRVFVEQRHGEVSAEATVKVLVGDERVVTTREGDGPVSALDRALRAALTGTYPDIERIRLTDFRVRDLDSSDGTSARVRVLVEHGDGIDSWGSVGVHENIIDASWKAVVDGLVVGLLRSTVVAKAQAQGLDLTGDDAQVVVDRIKELEHAGYQFEAADGSFELLLREAQGWKQPFFGVESYRVFVEQRHGEVSAEATVKVLVGDERVVTTREGDGPVSALDRALRAALTGTYPDIERIRLTDFRVRDLDSSDGTSARVRVLVEHGDGIDSWGSVGVHENIIDASWKAVVDGLVVGLLRSTERTAVAT